VGTESESKQTEVVLAQRAIEAVEIESQIATAKRYPRDIAKFKDKMMAMACLDQETAESCFYVLPRGGSPIIGPSVRLAEIALACYGNCVAESGVLNEDGRFIYTMGMCRDLENNVAVRVKVSRKITYKDGKTFNDDMIGVTANAACAVAFRNAVLKIIPGAFVKPVFGAVQRIAVGNAKPLEARRAEVIKRLTKFGVVEERVLAVIKRKSIDEVTFGDVAMLIGLGTAIRDGDTTIEDAFPPDFKTAQKEAGEQIKAEAGSEKVEVKFEETEQPVTDETDDSWLKNNQG